MSTDKEMRDEYIRIKLALWKCEYRSIPVESIILTENTYCWLRANSEIDEGSYVNVGNNRVPTRLPTLLGRRIKLGGEVGCTTNCILAPQSFKEGGRIGFYVRECDKKLVTLRLGVLK